MEPIPIGHQAGGDWTSRILIKERFKNDKKRRKLSKKYEKKLKK